MENNLPTAEMSRFNYRYRIGRKMTGSLLPSEEKEMMIEFAKLHVEAALKEASEDANMDTDYYQALQVYPLTNIK
jgi:hypothetical protein